jgi:hypothetical protein
MDETACIEASVVVVPSVCVGASTQLLWPIAEESKRVAPEKEDGAVCGG